MLIICMRTHTYMAAPGPRAAPGLPQAATTGCMEIVFHLYFKRAGVDANQNSFCSKCGFPRFWKRFLIFPDLIPEQSFAQTFFAAREARRQRIWVLSMGSSGLHGSWTIVSGFSAKLKARFSGYLFICDQRS